MELTQAEKDRMTALGAKAVVDQTQAEKDELAALKAKQLK